MQLKTATSIVLVAALMTLQAQAAPVAANLNSVAIATPPGSLVSTTAAPEIQDANATNVQAQAISAAASADATANANPTANAYYASDDEGDNAKWHGSWGKKWCPWWCNWGCWGCPWWGW
ncbi:hypothetical protein BGX23_000785 [Mortierella sp. AD031]|nr:hypothetical protein BGX23_000785 [Mortierella sp. AD031]